MNNSRQNLFPVPAGFHDIVRDLTLNILKDKPQDILYYGMLYFESKLKGSNFIYEGPKRQEITQTQQELQMYNSLFETYQFKKEQTSQNFTIVRGSSIQSNSQNRSTQIEVQRQPSELVNIFMKQQNSNDIAQDMHNIRLFENVSSNQSQKSDNFKFSLQSSIPTKQIQNDQQNQEVDMVESVKIKFQDIDQQLKNKISEKLEKNSSLNGIQKQKTNDLDLNTTYQKKKNESQANFNKDYASQQTQNQTCLTNFQNDLTLNNKLSGLNILQTLQQNNNQQQLQIEQNQQTTIFPDKLLFQDLNDDFKQIDIAENEVKNDNLLYNYNFLDGDDFEQSNLTIIQSNYNVQSQLKEQLLNFMLPKEEQPEYKKNIQDLVFSNQEQMKISVVQSMNMGAYQKSFIYINIMSARNLPLCMNTTCEVYLEGMKDQKIVTQPIYNNNEPDWYYLKKKLVLLVPKETEKLFEEINKKPLNLCANIFELSYSSNQQKRIDLATFKIPLAPIFHKEGEWSINSYFDCQEMFQQAKLYIQNSSLLQQQSESIEATLNSNYDKKLTHSNQKDIMASVDLNQENEKHQSVIQKLILSLSNQLYRIQGTLRVVIIKARKLQHAQDTNLKIQSPFVEYAITGDEGKITEIYDPHSKVPEEPTWFHDSNHKLDLNIGHKPILSVKLYDLQQNDKSNKIYMGEINLDLSILIDQPGKWLINNYYDLHYKTNLNLFAGQIYVQSKFIPGGLEDFHQEQFGPLSQLD